MFFLNNIGFVSLLLDFNGSFIFFYISLDTLESSFPSSLLSSHFLSGSLFVLWKKKNRASRVKCAQMDCTIDLFKKKKNVDSCQNKNICHNLCFSFRLHAQNVRRTCLSLLVGIMNYVSWRERYFGNRRHTPSLQRNFSNVHWSSILVKIKVVWQSLPSFNKLLPPLQLLLYF